MSGDRDHVRILIYSHDSFGLGHLRRCRTVAHSLVDHRPDLSVLILSGSPIIGSFDFRSRVDFVRIPGVIKLRHGDYTSLSLDIGVEDTLALRASIIRHTADIFAPDAFIVDKEPLGLRGEVKDTLTMLKARGVPLILGLRDILDEPRKLTEEWERKHVQPALENLYDQIWVYGLPQVCDPLEGVPISSAVRSKMHFTGYLRRTIGQGTFGNLAEHRVGSEPYLLVTTGGGGDGAGLVDWVLRAYEHDPGIPNPAIVVLGPFMRSNLQSGFMERAQRLGKVQAFIFDARVESLIAGAAGVVAMGGYNTFCEILSFDQRSLIVPRTVPRLEQYIRASRAQELGLGRMLVDDDVRSPRQMAAALRELPHQPRPSEIRIPGLLDGLSTINAMVDRWLAADRAGVDDLAVVAQNP
jgi:predicted glycosyltransferase